MLDLFVDDQYRTWIGTRRRRYARAWLSGIGEGKQGWAAPCTLRRAGQKGAVFSGRRRLLSEAGTRTTCKQVYPWPFAISVPFGDSLRSISPMGKITVDQATKLPIAVDWTHDWPPTLDAPNVQLDHRLGKELASTPRNFLALPCSSSAKLPFDTKW